MKEAGLAVKDEVQIKEALWDNRYHFHRLLKRATTELAAKTGALAIATTEEGDVYYAGAANILDMPEFYDIDLTKAVLMMVDRSDTLNDILDRAVGDESVHVLLGEDIGRDYLNFCGVVFSQFGAGKKNAGNIGVIGPVRMRFERVIPTVRYFGDLLTELSGTW
jgi:heat-inducible transcriptional repressor